MPDRKNLDFKAVEEWALAHGFQKARDTLLFAPYGEGRVHIEFLARNIRVSSVWGKHNQRLITTHPKRLHIDENDMLQGAGLFSRFYSSYRDDYRESGEDAVMPIWFGEKVRSMVNEHVADEVAISKRSPV
jgi:hypothetical protein